MLVACTINAPTENDFTKLPETMEILSREVYADTNVRIFPLVCSATVAYPPYRDSGDGVLGVSVLDADRLRLGLPRSITRLGFGHDRNNWRPMFGVLGTPTNRNKGYTAGTRIMTRV